MKVRIRNQFNISAIKHLLIILAFILNISCNEKNEQVINSSEQNGTSVILHRTVLSDLPADSKPLQVLLNKAVKPKAGQLPSDGVKQIDNELGSSLQVRKFTALVTHLFIDTLTGLPIPEDAQGKGLFTTYTTDDGLSLDQIHCSYKDRKGNLWFGTNGGGVSKYDGKVFTNYSVLQGLAGNVVWSILEDKNGNLWFGTDGNGASKYDGKVFTKYSVVHGLAADVVLSIKEDRNGNLWFGTFKGGVSKYDGRNFTNYSTAEGLSNSSVADIIEDENGEMWFGTNGGGVKRFDGKHFTTYTKANGLSSNSIRSIRQDKEGNIWFGTDYGLSKYDGKTFTSYTSAEGLANNSVLTLTIDKKGNIWVGTNGGGASKFDGQRFTNYSTSQGLVNNTVQCIVEDDRGNLWFGTFGGGISKFDGKSFTHFTKSQGLPNNVILCITEDKNGNLWFGTAGSGISRFDGKSFTNFSTSQGLLDNVVWAISEDRNGNTWVGTQQGLSVMPKKNVDMLQRINATDTTLTGPLFQSFTNSDGMPDNFVTQIVQGNDQLYIGTNIGICEIVAGASANSPEKQWHVARTFNSRTGYPVKDVNAGTAMFKDSRGIIWIGTGSDKTGLVRFDPHSEVRKSIKPPVLVIQSIQVNQQSVIWNDLDTTQTARATQAKLTPPNIIEEVSAFGRPLSDAERSTMQRIFGDLSFQGIRSWYPIPENLVLPYEKNTISFDFNSIETGKNHLVKYQYLLEGYDKDWSPPNHKASATFGNIYEGNYSFKVRAQSPEGIWTEAITYSFRVLPPWWRSWWRYILNVAIVVVIIMFIFRWNHQRIIQQRNVLEHKVAVATRQITEEKENVEAQKKIVEDTLKDLESAQAQLIQSEKMASLGELTAGIAHEIQNPLNFVNNFSEVNTELIGELEQEVDKGNLTEIKLLTKDIKENEQKINLHGKRADAIVKGMLQHSRTSSGIKELTDINALADEYLRLSYHGLRAKDKSFNVEFDTDFDPSIGKLNVVPQDIGRALLNLINNAFYAVSAKASSTAVGNFEPTVTVSTKRSGDRIFISVKDNGNGIPHKVLDKIFQPFFTTKPTGQGTGLGLSLSYDIVKAHGGEIKVFTKENDGSEFIIQLPIV